MIKNHPQQEKVTKSVKNQESEKVTKSEKAKKWQNTKNDKMQKVKKWQNQNHEKHKKWSKIDPPLKKAKMSLKWSKSTLCEIRAAWSGVFSIPGGTTGPDS